MTVTPSHSDVNSGLGDCRNQIFFHSCTKLGGGKNTCFSILVSVMGGEKTRLYLFFFIF